MAYLDNNGVLYLWAKIKAFVSSAVAGLYTKPSGGIPASDLAAGVIPTVPQMATQTDMNDWTSGKTVDASAMKTVVSAARTLILENSGYIDDLRESKQNASLEIPVTESGDTYSTTVTAEQIRAAKENSVFVFGGEARIKALLWFPWEEDVDLLVGIEALGSTIVSVAASVAANSVSIRVQQTQIPALATDPNMTDWESGKAVDAAVLKNGVQNIELMIEGKADASSLNNYALKSDISSMYKYKGSVATASALPSSGNTTGDVYNVESTGMNYAWNGTAWDALGESFQITAITNAEIDAICT